MGKIITIDHMRSRDRLLLSLSAWAHCLNIRVTDMQQHSVHGERSFFRLVNELVWSVLLEVRDYFICNYWKCFFRIWLYYCFSIEKAALRPSRSMESLCSLPTGRARAYLNLITGQHKCDGVILNSTNFVSSHSKMLLLFHPLQMMTEQETVQLVALLFQMWNPERWDLTHSMTWANMTKTGSLKGTKLARHQVAGALVWIKRGRQGPL